MKHILLPNEEFHRLPFYLAMEEYLAEHCEENLFFMWQVAPTVIFGRNQVMADEVNIDFCEKNGIQYYRRKSGGGCVFADRGNIMLSCVMPRKSSDEAFCEFLSKVAGILTDLGCEAVKTEHNDILVGGMKVSGNALFATERACIVHGTLMYDVDMGMLQKAITPSKAKLGRHGIQSVRQRVANLKDLGITLTAEELKQHFVRALCNEGRMLSLDEMKQISNIEREYYDPKFLRSK